jgi:hypothetical protein
LLSEYQTRQSREVWYAISSFLAHTAIVSKLFDPIGYDQTKIERGNALKAYLGIADDSPLLIRNARDNLEHIDERIDGWVKRGETKIVEMAFDDREGYNLILSRNGAVRRVIIISEMVFVSENRNGKRIETELLPIRDILLNLHKHCHNKLFHESPYNMIVSSKSLN